METVIERLRQTFPDSTITPLAGGGTTALYLLGQSTERSVLKVAMLSKVNAEVEAICLQVGSANKLAPCLYQSFAIEERTVLHMEFIHM